MFQETPTSDGFAPPGNEGRTNRARRPIPAALEDYQAFPTTSLPEPLCSFVVESSKAIGCDEAFVALPMFSIVASAIGGTRAIEVKRGFREPSILWTAIIGRSGTAKTPALQAAAMPLRLLTKQESESYGKKIQVYERRKAEYEKEYQAWKNGKTNGEPPEPVYEPMPPSYSIGDCTLEALAEILDRQARGTLVVRDELAGWFGSLDRYHAGKGDAQAFLEMYNAGSFQVRRKTGKRFIDIQRAVVSVTGGLQPSTAKQVLNQQARDSGMAARFLLCCPPHHVTLLTDDECPYAVERSYFDLVHRLHQIPQDEAGPFCLVPDREAYALFRSFYDSTKTESIQEPEAVSASWMKLISATARLALMFAVIRDEAEHTVNASDMSRAIAIGEWFKAEHRRVYRMLMCSERDYDMLQAITALKSLDRRATVRELMRHSRAFATASDWEIVLHRLSADGLGEWQRVDDNGRPGPKRRVFVLYDETNDVDAVDVDEFD